MRTWALWTAVILAGLAGTGEALLELICRGAHDRS
jgi:hypothetical protein